MKVVFKKSDAVEPFSFRFTDDDGKTLLKSENYKARASALNGINSVKKNASTEKRYELKTAKNGKAYFNLKATNGQVIGTSPMFDDENKRQSIITLLSSSAASAELDDQSKAPATKAKAAAKVTKPGSAAVKKKAEVNLTNSPKKAAAPSPEKSKSVAKAVESKSDEEKASAVSQAADKSTESSSDVVITDIAEAQLDSTTETIVSALNTLNTQLEQARESGSLRGKEIVKGLGGDNKMMKLIEDLAGYMGEAAGAGVTMGATPMIVMAGTAKGIYKKITE